MSRRDRLYIIGDILKKVSEKESKMTDLMYGGRLSFSQWKRYKEDLLKSELMIENNGSDRKTYKISEKGKEFLKRFREIKNLVV